MSLGEKLLAGWSRRGKLNAGAGLPTNGDGTSRGFKNKPLKRKPAIMRNSAKGISAFFMHVDLGQQRLI
jgi:hypothetical protein